MDALDLSNFFVILLVIVAVAVGAMFAMFFAIRKRDELIERTKVARDDIRQRRKQRSALMNQVLSLFGNGNPMAESLSKLAKLYLVIDSEEKEILWEEKYVVVMRKFLDLAKGKTDGGNLSKAWEMASKSVSDNEDALEAARNVYDETILELESLEKPPMSWLLYGGDIIMSLMRTVDEQKLQLEEENKKKEADGTVRESEQQSQKLK